MEQYLQNYHRWLTSEKLSLAERAELAAIKDDDNEIRLRFTNYLSFGTAGLRGTMKVGMNAMNVHTVAYATQALADLIVSEGRAADGVAIAYDSRNNSPLFAKTAACVLAAAGIPAYLFDELRPTPELSFALRELGCVAGINITASHNPKQYNGYKAYWEDGAQLPPEHADVVSATMAKLDIFEDVQLADFDEALAAGKIIMLGKDMDEKYLACVQAQAVNPEAVKAVADDLKIVYTPLHGTGYRLVPEILRRTGLKHLYTVPEQMIIDGNFPTVSKPNPEYTEAFTLGMAIADEVGSDLVVATDPDADRVGVVTRTPDGSFVTITGNQMGALLMDYILTAYEETGTMPEIPFAVKTIVTTELAAKICAAHGVKMHNVLTGFKFIGEVIKDYEQKGYGTFVLGFEESYGYLKGTYARDKDAVVAAMLICEMTAYYKAKGMTLSDALDGLYARYGYCYEANVEIYMEGLDGPARMAEKMNALRPAPAEIAGQKVIRAGDYQAQTITDCVTGAAESTGLPKSNVLSFTLENGDVIVARPSGTEPKIKFYFMLAGKDKAETVEKMAKYRESLDVNHNQQRYPPMFHITPTRFHWIDDLPDNGTDLCLHAEAVARIGERELSYDASVTSTALYLLKTLTEDHLIGTGNQILPCCGHMWVPSEQDPASVEIIGCNCGIDWSVEHEDDSIRLTLEDGYTVTLPLTDYAAEVCRFADEVEAFYRAAPPRIVGDDAYDQAVFSLYWQEFRRRRGMFP